jgi:predicted O-methyltransferase YrrM
MASFIKQALKLALKIDLICFLKSNVLHFELSFLTTMHDDPFQPNQRLINIGLNAADLANDICLKEVADLFPELMARKYITCWPGEHYRLLAAIVKFLKPKLIIEVGTHQGASALSMKQHMINDAKIITYDIIPWHHINGTGFKQSDFDLNLEQRLIDLTIPINEESQRLVFQDADLIFVDADKDGKMEQLFCDYFDSIKFNTKPLIIFDDIRLPNMIKIWRNIKHPKLDLTSFGHYSGTGLVDWCG